MKRIVLLSVALISLVCASGAATRPRYGGTLRIEMQSAPATLELPPLNTPTDYWDMARVLALVGDNLVGIDVEAHPQPALALAWERDSVGRHWQFTLRHGAKFHDGSSASASAIAQILGGLHADWNVRASGDSLIVDT
jgi:peptide/nickel transport system substrate-binding protein